VVFSTSTFAYFTDSVDDDLLNDVDVLIIERCKHPAWLPDVPTLPTFPAFSTDANEPNSGEQPLLESSMAYSSIGGARLILGLVC
jgi:hypothetical protein